MDKVSLVWQPERLKVFETIKLVMAELTQEQPGLDLFPHLCLYEAWRRRLCQEVGWRLEGEVGVGILTADLVGQDWWGKFVGEMEAGAH
jgi:hypothetical protein